MQYLPAIYAARLRHRRAFRVLVISAEDLVILDVEVERRPGNSATEVQDLWNVDIGVMPLPDAPWVRAKCA